MRRRCAIMSSWSPAATDRARRRNDRGDLHLRPSTVDGGVLDRLPRVRVISTRVGVDHIDVGAATGAASGRQYARHSRGAPRTRRSLCSWRRPPAGEGSLRRAATIFWLRSVPICWAARFTAQRIGILAWAHRTQVAPGGARVRHDVLYQNRQRRPDVQAPSCEVRHPR